VNGTELALRILMMSKLKVNFASYQLSEIILLIVFIVVNLLIYSLSFDSYAPLAAGADAGQYLRPARSLVDYGEFTMNPPGWTPEMGDSRSFTFGTPLYSILLAIPYFIFGQNEYFFALVIIMQCAILFYTGWLSRFFLPFLGSNRLLLIHALVIFNPNSLTTAHLIQSETLFTLFVVLSVLNIFRYIKYGALKSLLYTGFFAGLLTLTRPAGLYFVYAIPLIIIAIIVLRSFQNKEITIFNKQSLLSIFVPILISFLVMSPWYARNYINNNEVFLTSESGTYLKDNYQTLIQRGRGLTQKEAYDYTNDQKMRYFNENGISLNCMTNERDPDCGNYVFSAVFNGLIDEPIKNHAKALFYSWGVLYFSGGASNFRNYVGWEGNSIIVDFHNEKFNGISSIVRLIKRMNTDYLIIFIIFTGFAFIARFSALVGLVNLLRTPKYYSYLFVIFGIIIIFTAMYLYLGQSRFRVPLEPILLLLSVLALKNK
jgi:hypothetical protein